MSGVVSQASIMLDTTLYSQSQVRFSSEVAYQLISINVVPSLKSVNVSFSNSHSVSIATNSSDISCSRLAAGPTVAETSTHGLFLVGRLQDLEAAHESLVDAHHGA